MAVGDRLASCFAVVDPNVEPADRGVTGFDIRSLGLEQCGAGVHFGLPEFEIAPDVPLRDNESMEVGHGISVADHVREYVLPIFLDSSDLAEHTSVCSVLVRVPNPTEVCIIAVPLHRVAAVTKRLKIAGIIRATFVSRDDVVHF